MIQLTIDDRKVTVAPGTTILEAARQAGVEEIPTLCHDERLHAYGSCFLCVVELPGTKKLFPACATEVREGMVVLTRSERVLAARKRALELLLSDHYADCLGPCRMACPAGVDIQGYVALVAAGKFVEAARLIRENNPLPAICGRICVRKCEVACRRTALDGAVGINMIKRFATEQVDHAGLRAALRPTVARPTGYRVAVVGAGPAGLAAADFLVRSGHQVTIYEAAPAAGGMLRYGIPEYRLPRDILDRDVQGILELGVTLKLNTRLGPDFTLEGLRQEYDAIFLGLGAQNGSPMKVRGEDQPGVRSGVDFLRNNELQGHPSLQGRVVVVGGGNTAIDCARTALRCGATEVNLVYRRTRAEMPANAEEIAAAIREGVQMTFLTAPLEVLGEEGHLRALRCQRMELGEPDKSGRRKPVPVVGSEYEIPCEHLLAAIGQQVDLDGLQDTHAIGVTAWKTIVAEGDGLATGLDGVFAGGDVVLGPAVVIDAIAQGRQAAAAIDRYLTGRPTSLKPGFVSSKDSAGGPTPQELQARVAAAGAEQHRAPQPERHAERWAGDWQEVELRLTEEAALAEAHRCLSCGCTDFFTCELRRYASEYQADLSLTKGQVLRHEVDRRHPHLELDPNKCILCARCIRVCEAVLGGSVLGLVNRGFVTVVQPSLGRPLQETGCISCGACVDVCPTGAIAEKGTRFQHGPWKPAWQPQVCTHCGVGCEVELDLSGGNVSVRPRGGAAAPIGSICERGRYGRVLLTGERLTTPLVRGGDGELHPASWRQAIQRATEGLLAARNQEGGGVGVFAAPTLTNEEAHLLSHLARAGLATDYVGPLESLLTGAELDGLDPVWGHTTSTARLADLEQADLILLCNADPLTDHPVLGLAIRRAVRRGATLVGLATSGALASEAAAWYPGRRGHGALTFSWMARHLIDQSSLLAVGRGGLLPGVDELKQGLGSTDPVEVSRQTGVAVERLEELARLLADPARTLLAIYDPERTVDRAPGLLEALALFLATAGRIGAPGSGLLLPTRHANLRGLLDAGLYPGKLPSRLAWKQAEARPGQPSAWDRLQTTPRTRSDVVRAVEQGSLQAALLVGEDPLGHPTLAPHFVRPTFLVALDRVPTATTRAADVVLPIGDLTEAEGTLTAFDRTIRAIQPLAPPPSGMATIQLLADLARGLGLTLDAGPVDVAHLTAQLTSPRPE